MAKRRRRDLPENLEIWNAQIRWRNFAGNPGQYNNAGNRNFALMLDEEQYEEFKAAGWNVKRLEPREDGDDPTFFLKVKVSYAKRPPKVVLVTSKNQTLLDETTIGPTLDFADIESCNMVIAPSPWEMSDGRSGITAYLNVLYVKINEDPFEDAFANPPTSSKNCVGPDCPLD